MKIFNTEVIKKNNQRVHLAGWVNARRNHGGVIFINLRDRSGLVQLVCNSERKGVYAAASLLHPEWVIEVKGRVQERPERMKNPKLKTGSFEVEVEELKVLSTAKTPPFEIATNTKKIDEEIRMKYRYLDLRSERMRKILELRHNALGFIRRYLSKNGFWEIETPILTKSTPEGARDYLVPSRQQPGKFYALPQSPQQFKQILMVAGVEKYFQIARCFRDEDLRGDRQPEFTQLDIEMSFATQEDILDLIEDLMVTLVQKIAPNKKVTFVPFPRLRYKEVIKKYQTDRPDLRSDKKNPDELAFAFIVDWPMFEYNGKDKRWDPCHHIFTASKDEDLHLLEKKPALVRSWQHDLVLNGFEIGGGSLRITDPKVQEKVLELVGISKEQIKLRFGHLIQSFKYGVPPHGGIACGLDRLIMILSNETSIREVIPFPKTGDGRDLMMEAPSEVEQEQLAELHLKVTK